MPEPDLSEFLGHVRGAPAVAGANKLRDIIIPQLPEEKQASLHAAAFNPEITVMAIRRVLRDWGFSISEGTISKWRAGLQDDDAA